MSFSENRLPLFRNMLQSGSPDAATGAMSEAGRVAAEMRLTID
jgi:hypothetical protein